MAAGAFPQGSRRNEPPLAALAPRAGKALGPPTGEKVVHARLLVTERGLELQNRLRKTRPCHIAKLYLS
jgi:hypothetical protein